MNNSNNRQWIFSFVTIGVWAFLINPVLGQQPAGTWPQFRGPLADGHADANNLPIEFNDDKNVVWKTELPGRGWSSPVIVDGKAWMTTAIEIVAEGEALEEKMKDADIGGMSAYSRVELKALCVDIETGKLETTLDLFSVDDPPLIHSLNSFASPSAVADDENVYFHFGTFGTAAIKRDSAELLWKTQEFPLEHQTGPGSSPFLFEGKLILHCDGCDQQYVVALDASTGKQIWRTDRSGELHQNPMFKKAFSTPVIAQRGDKQELISPGANWVYGYDPDSGEELWKFSYGQLGFSNVSRPIVKDDMLYVCSCYMESTMMAVDIAGSDPVNESNVKWTYKKQVPNMPSAIEVDGAIYFVDDRGFATCLNAESGELHWRGRLGGGFSSSPILADGKLYFCNHDGTVFVVQPGTAELNIVGENQLDGQIMASPAAIGNGLFIRTAKSFYRFSN